MNLKHVFHLNSRVVFCLLKNLSRLTDMRTFHSNDDFGSMPRDFRIRRKVLKQLHVAACFMCYLKEKVHCASRIFQGISLHPF